MEHMQFWGFLHDKSRILFWQSAHIALTLLPYDNLVEAWSTLTYVSGTCLVLSSLYSVQTGKQKKGDESGAKSAQ